VLLNRLFLKITIAPSNLIIVFLPSNWPNFYFEYFFSRKSTGEAIFNLLPAHGDQLLYHFGNSSCSVNSSLSGLAFGGTSVKINKANAFLFQNLMEALACNNWWCGSLDISSK
jgi:hypothetical protein